MSHSCQFLCSELVTVTYEEQPGEIYQRTANLEEISTDRAVVLLDEKPQLGAPISLALKGHDLFGVVTSRMYDTTLGWFVTVTLDAASKWRNDWFAPEHLLTMCECCFEDTTRTKARALENTKYTEKIVPVRFVWSGA